MGTNTDPSTPPPTPTVPPASPPPATPPAVVDSLDDDDLGDSGVKALNAWKERAKAAEKDAKRTKDLEAENATLRAAQMSEADKAIEAARKEGADEALAAERATTNGRLLKSELKAATAGKLLPAAATDLLIDSTVALRLLGLDEIPVTSTGDIDGEAISQAVDAYVTSRPHLAASATPPPVIDQGSRQPPPGAKTLDEQIAEAEAAGNWKVSGRLKTQKLLAH